MTREEILKLALEAGGRMYASDEVEFFLPDLERFAALVAAAEREACAKTAEQELLNTNVLMSMPPKSSAAWNILNAIRARGQA